MSRSSSTSRICGSSDMSRALPIRPKTAPALECRELCRRRRASIRSTMTGASERANAALARGDLITAYDTTVSAIAEGDESPALRHLQVLALARMGDTERAMELFSVHSLAESPDPHHRAVGARLLKDRALALSPGEERTAALQTAFEAYHTI